MANRPLNPPEGDAVDQARWVTIVTLLSMDIVVPFYDLMGFRPPNPGALRDLLRTLILEIRREIDANLSTGIGITPRAFLDRIGAALGSAVRSHVFWWGSRIFDYSLDDHLALDAWTNLLRYRGSDSALWRGIPHELRDDLLSEFKRSLDTREYSQRKQEIGNKPLSDWDLHIYAAYAFDDEDPAAPSGPYTYVKPTTKTYQGYSFWSWVFKRFRPQDLETLYENALPITQESDNKPLMDPLAHPRALDVGL